MSGRQPDGGQQRVRRAGEHADQLTVGFQLQRGRCVHVVQVNCPAVDLLHVWQVTDHTHCAGQSALRGQQPEHKCQLVGRSDIRQVRQNDAPQVCRRLRLAACLPEHHAQ